MVSRRARLLTSCLTATVLTLGGSSSIQAADPLGLFGSRKAATPVVADPAAPRLVPMETAEPAAAESTPSELPTRLPPLPQVVPQATAPEVSATKPAEAAVKSAEVVPAPAPAVVPAPAVAATPTTTIKAEGVPAGTGCGTAGGCPTGCAVPAAVPAAGDELFWVSAEYLFWFVRSSPLPFPLVTTATPGTLVPGALNTSSLFGQENVNGDNPYSGLRVRLGTYSDNLGVGLDVAGFFLGSQTTNFGAGTQDIVARPFYNTATSEEAVNYLRYPNAVLGGVNIAVETQLWGAEANLTRPLDCGPIEMAYVGFRYLGLREELNIRDHTTLVPGGVGFFGGEPISEGDIRLKQDLFRTRNDFYGAQVGLKAGLRHGAFDLNVRSAVGFGVCVEQVSVRGSTTWIPVNGSGGTLPGGLLAQGSNTRTETSNRFAVAPEVDLSLGCQVTPWGRVFVGYNFLYLSSVVRPGDQIDRSVNPQQMPISPNYDPSVTTGGPRSLFNTSDFWAQGLNFGMAVSF